MVKPGLSQMDKFRMSVHVFFFSDCSINHDSYIISYNISYHIMSYDRVYRYDHVCHCHTHRPWTNASMLQVQGPWVKWWITLEYNRLYTLNLEHVLLLFEFSSRKNCYQRCDVKPQINLSSNFTHLWCNLLSNAAI